MALATATVTFDLADILGVDFDARRTKVWVDTNVPNDTIVDTVGNQIRLGSGNVTIAADGTGSVVVWVPGAGSNPASWQTTVHVDYPDSHAHGGRSRRDFGPYTITASANLADLVDEQEVPPTYLSALTTQLDEYATDAANSAAIAQSAADLAQSISGIDSVDDAITLLDATPSSDFRVAQDARLSATIAAGVAPNAARIKRSPDRAYQKAATLAVMATSPTFTTSAAATITGQVIDLKTDPRITWHGPTRLSSDASSIIVRDAVQADGTTYGAGPAVWESLEFMFDGSAVEFFIWNGGSAKGCVLTVDGERHSATQSSATAEYLKFDFGGRKSDGSPRRIQFTCQSSYFKQLRVAATDTVYPLPSNPPRMTILGDSYATGFAAYAETSIYDGYGQQLARILGYQYRAHGAMSNTGYIKTNAPYGNYASRVASVAADNPDLVIVQGSPNDDPYTPTQIGTEAASLFASLKAALPNVPIVATGILSARPTASQSGDAAKNAAIKSAADAAGIPFIDTGAWITGTGRVGATTGVGNSDLYVHTDSIHPTKAGGFYYATRLAGAIRRAVPTLLA